MYHRYRWSLRWRYYKLRYMKQHRTDVMLLVDTNQEVEYSCYVVYPLESDDVRRWVTGTLLEGVEQRLEKPPLFIKGRDDLGGQH